jgi:hypothetical protein
MASVLRAIDGLALAQEKKRSGFVVAWAGIGGVADQAQFGRNLLGGEGSLWTGQRVRQTFDLDLWPVVNI